MNGKKAKALRRTHREIMKKITWPAPKTDEQQEAMPMLAKHYPRMVYNKMKDDLKKGILTDKELVLREGINVGRRGYTASR